MTDRADWRGVLAAGLRWIVMLVAAAAAVKPGVWSVPVYATDTAAENHDDELSRAAVALVQLRCGACHGAEKQEGSLRLDNREQLLAGGDRGAALNLVELEQSLIHLSITATADDELAMPPGQPLASAEIDVLTRWIQAGAHWPALNSPQSGSSDNGNGAAADGTTTGDAWTDPSNPVRQTFPPQRLDVWSLKPIQRPAVPAVADGTWCETPIDRFYWQRWQEEAARPASDIDPHRLARRLSFGLTGLPPEFHRSEQFIDQSNRWGTAAAARRYIDELLASPQYGEHWARHWLDVVRYSDSNGFDWDEFRPHAYKFRDYVVDAFNQDLPYDTFVRQQLAGDEMLGELDSSADRRLALIATGYLRLGPYDNAAGLFDEQDRSRSELLADLVETTGSAFLGLTLSCCRCHDHKTDPLLQADHFRLRAFFAAVRFADDLPVDQSDEPEFALCMTDQADEISETFILYGGDHKQPRERVQPGFLSIIDPRPASISPLPAGVASTGRRTALARWITSSDNPLTARVIVNRLWQAHFGQGLVATANDFGLSGAPPSDPALLDYLASELIASGWSIKHLQRLITSSHIYRQGIGTGEHTDARGTAAVRSGLQRLAAEELRDAMLHSAGALELRAGGPPVWPPLAEEILQANPAFLDDNKTKTKGWYPSPGSAQYVRGIYLIKKRSVKIPFLETFDLPDNATSCAARERAIVAPQALTLLNDPVVEDICMHMAKRIALTAGDDPQATVETAFQLALGRRPEDAERVGCEAYLREHSTIELCRALINTNEFMFVD